VTPAAADLCDHDGKASGRLVLEGGGISREIVCECGQVIALLGRDEYDLSRLSSRRGRTSRRRWRRSRSMHFSARRRRGAGSPEKVLPTS
jgi:hypothetical protein